MTDTIQIPESIHALLSPSKAHMWLKCPAALAAGKGKPSKPATRYAAEGTVYHDVARRALTEGNPCTAYVGDRYNVQGFEFIVDELNADYAQSYVDAVRALPGKHFVEVDLEYSRLLGVPKKHYDAPVAAGTSDSVVLDYENRTIYTGDLKFGRGDVVYASEVITVDGEEQRAPNPQLALYSAPAAQKFEILGVDDDWWVVMSIYQPRVPHFDSYRMKVGELKAWVARQRQAAQAAFSLYVEGPEKLNGSEFTPGEKQCRWCPLTGRCPAQARQVLDQFPAVEPGAATQAHVEELDEVELAQILDKVPTWEHFIKAVQAEALRRALEGRTLPNWKLVEGRRGNRQLDTSKVIPLPVETLREIGVAAEVDSELQIEDAVYFALGNGAYTPRELLTVAKLQKPLEKKAPLLWTALQTYITQSEGAPSLTRIEDPRPPKPMISSEFPVAETASGLL